MPTADEVVVEFEARISKYESDLKRGTAAFSNAVNTQRAQMKALERQISASSGKIGSDLKGLAAAFAAGFSVQKIQQLADSYTRFTNQLKVAGQEGAGLAKTQENLFDISQKYGVELESTGTLYSRASQASKELGANQQQLLQFTEGVAAALKIQGTSATESSGALLQLGQLLATGTVRAEEFNSVNEGALPVLKAVAANIDAAGGSVAKLKLLVNDGKISSQQFFQAFLAGSTELKETAESTTLTIGNSFTVLNNALGKYIGEADQSLSATERISGAILTLAENLDTVAQALAVIAALFIGRYAAGAIAAARSTALVSTALFAVQARAAGAATTMEALALTGATAGRTLLAAFGGPVGASIAALTVAFAVLSTSTDEAGVSAEELSASIKNQTAEFAAANAKTVAAAVAADKMTGAQRATATATASLTGEVKLLGTAWGRVAALAKAAAIEQARAALAGAKANLTAAQSLVDRRRQQELDRPSNAPSGSPVGVIGRFTRGISNAIFPNLQAELRKESQAEREQLAAARENFVHATKDLAEISSQKLAEFKAPDPEAPAGKPGKTKKGAAAPKGPKAKDFDAIENRQLEDLSRLRQEQLQAELDLTTDAKERAALMSQLLAEEFTQRVAQVENDKDFTKDQKAAQIAALEVLYGKVISGRDENGEIVVESSDKGLLGRRVQKELDDRILAQKQEMLREEQDALEAQIEITDSLVEKHKLERRALEIQQEIERSLLEQQIANGEIADADKARALLAGRQTSQRESLSRDQQSPMDRYRSDLKSTATNLNEAVQSLEVETLKSFSSELANAIVNFENLGQVGVNALKKLAAGLIELAIQQVILSVIGKSLGGGAAATSMAEGAAVASAWAPAAAAVSLATLGGAAVPAAAALIATNALSLGLAQVGGKKGGGAISGPGGPKDDKVLQWLSDGEFVMQASSVAKIGQQNLERMNATGEVPVLPNGQGVRAPGGGGGLELGFHRDLKSTIAEAVKAMPPIQLFPTLSPGATLRAALNEPEGRKAMFDFHGNNSGKFRAVQ